MDGKYSQVGDYLLPNLVLPEDEQKPIGIWGQRHARHLKRYRYYEVLYMNLLTSGKLNGYLDDIDEQAKDMFSYLVKNMAEEQGVTEQLKTENQMEWIVRMNSICNSITAIIYDNLIYPV